jgi:hypothetical protein
MNDSSLAIWRGCSLPGYSGLPATSVEPVALAVVDAVLVVAGDLSAIATPLHAPVDARLGNPGGADCQQAGYAGNRKHT